MNTIQKTLFIGKQWLHFPELASTNDYANQLLSKSNPSDGTVISTYNQVRGKGQSGSKWESEPDKNIASTFILYPKFVAAREQFVFNQAISLAVMDFIGNFTSFAPKVKWSNDIYVLDKKICGILIQNGLLGRNLNNSIIGIGINVNQTIFRSDAPNPTSLKIETGKEFDLNQLLEILCSNVEARYLQLKAGRINKLKQDYLENLYRYMEDALYQIPNGEVFQGRIIGVGEFGKLQIQTKKGIQEFDTKEVKFVL